MKRLLILLTIIMTVSCQENNSDNNLIGDISNSQLDSVYRELKSIYTELAPRVIQPAEGYLKYPYLIPAGFYKQMWDWDGFFMGNYFCSKDHPEYLQYWALNLIEGIDDKGYVSGCATTKGPRPIFGDFSMKPFLSQGVLLSSRKANDFQWIKPYYDKLCRAIAYREKTQRDSATGLFFWQIAMQSGADNNVALNYFKDDTRSFIACDASALQLREYKAQAIIAGELGMESDHLVYSQKAEAIEAAIMKYLWCEEDETFYNLDRETLAYYKRISYSNFIPLIEKIAPQEKGKAMIERYLTNPDYMKAKYGFRSLSAQDPDYNNKNIIVPYSNWQGPVWPIANYLYSIALKQYGFDDEVKFIAYTLGKKLIEDYRQYGSLHENYNAETGAPLAPAESYVDSTGKFVGFISWNLCIENVLAGVVENKWMLLDLK